MVATAEPPQLDPAPRNHRLNVASPTRPEPQPQQKSHQRPRLALLDGLRLVAALGVVLFHWTAWHHSNWGRHGDPAAAAWPWLSQLTSVGAVGVQLFFIISGFVILLSSFGKSPARFIGSRVGRLYPAYWFAVLATSALTFLIAPQLGTRRSPSDIWANLTMFQGGLGVGHIDGVYWTLWVEMKFYLWILAFMLVGMTVRRVLVFAFAWPLLGNLLFFAVRGAGQPTTWVDHVFFPEYSALFAGGMALFLLFRFGHTPLRWAALVMNAGFGAYWTATVQQRETAKLTGYDYSSWLFVGIAFVLFALVAVIVLSPLAWLAVPGMTLAGQLTYPVYLLHQLWGWWIIVLLSPFLSRELVLAFALAAMLGAAWLVHRWVERPLGPPLQRAVTAGVGKWRVLGKEPMRKEPLEKEPVS
ncbi:acyltransferase family protein [Citricoccus sp. GCM10030269]|uniref:acyltransferase family protein n=1 Tax=Citricoccus sp. GCM10030269 TaxID=3273388 RepID=UPI00361E3969